MKIPDQEEVLARIEELEASCTTLEIALRARGSNVPARPKAATFEFHGAQVEDIIEKADLIEAHAFKLKAMLDYSAPAKPIAQSVTPSAQPKAVAPAKSQAAPSPVSTDEAVKMTLTERARAVRAGRQLLPRQPVGLTAKALAAKSGN